MNLMDVDDGRSLYSPDDALILRNILLWSVRLFPNALMRTMNVAIMGYFILYLGYVTA